MLRKRELTRILRNQLDDLTKALEKVKDPLAGPHFRQDTTVSLEIRVQAEAQQRADVHEP